MFYWLKKTWEVIKKPKNILDSWGVIVNIPINWFFSAERRGVTFGLTAASVVSSSIVCVYKMWGKLKELSNERSKLKILGLKIPTVNGAVFAKTMTIVGGLTTLQALAMYGVGMYYDMPIAVNVTFISVFVASAPLFAKMFDRITRDEIEACQKAREDIPTEEVVGKISTTPTILENLSPAILRKLINQRWLPQDEQLRTVNMLLGGASKKLAELQQGGEKARTAIGRLLSEMEQLGAKQIPEIEQHLTSEEKGRIEHFANEKPIRMDRLTTAEKQEIEHLEKVLVEPQQCVTERLTISLRKPQQHGTEQLTAELWSLQQHMQELLARVEETKIKFSFERTKIHIGQLATELGELQPFWQEIQVEMDGVSSRIKTNLSEPIAQIEILQAELGALQQCQQVSGMEIDKTCSELKARLEKPTAQIKNSEKELSELQQRQQTIEKKLLSIISVLKKMLGQVKELQENLLQLQQSVQKTQAEAGELKTQLEYSTEKQPAAGIDGLRFSLKGINQEKEDLARELQTLQQQNSLSQKAADEINVVLEGTVAQIERLIEDIKKLQTRGEKSQEEIVRVGASLEQAKKNVGFLEENLTALSQQQGARTSASGGKSGLGTFSCIFQPPSTSTEVQQQSSRRTSFSPNPQ